MSLGCYYALDVTCRGEADARTGYLMNITHIDAAVRDEAIPRIETAVHAVCAGTDSARDTSLLLRDIYVALDARLDGTVTELVFRLTPFHALRLGGDDMSKVLVEQHFSFAAAHRLHCAELSDAENVAVFGRCNNKNGHGHNYEMRVTVAVDLPDGNHAATPDLETLERIVDETVVQRFDHTHLNLDTAEFADLIPSVENITKTSHDLLVDPIRAAGGELRRVTVWETEKTSCTYPAS